jgi:transcriptional regulator with GAF, ATPase, and Fis domain
MKAPDSGVSKLAELDDEAFRQFEPFFHRSEQMRAVANLVFEVAKTDAPVLIRGEVGVGKERIARAIHSLSRRFVKPWLKINCASLPPELLECELFGYERGAFPGAEARKLGRLELAHEGTVFLDEVGELPLRVQAKLVHVLADGDFFRVGGRELIRVDVRVAAATSDDLVSRIAAGVYQQNLYDRLNGVSILVPPLRERRGDIPFFVHYFRDRFALELGRGGRAFSADTLDLMLSYDWPGNDLELETLIKRYVMLDDESLLRQELQTRIEARTRPAAVTAPTELGLREIGRRAAHDAERAALKEVLEQVQWNRAEAARVLKISYKTLLHKLEAAGFAPKPRGRRRP